MKGFIPRTVLGLTLCLSSLAGCSCYREIVDPCWPERYNAMAQDIIAMFCSAIPKRIPRPISLARLRMP